MDTKDSNLVETIATKHNLAILKQSFFTVKNLHILHHSLSVEKELKGGTCLCFFFVSKTKILFSDSPRPPYI